MRDYKKEYREYHARPEQKRNRAARNLWNRRLKGRVPAGKEIDHKQPLVNGGSNTRANIRYRSVSANRGDKSHMKTAQRADGDTHEKRETRTTRNVMLGLSALGALGGGAYLLRNRRRASAPTWDNLGKGSVNTAPLDDKPSAGVLSVDTGDVSRHAPPSPASQGPRNLGEIVREQQRANAKVFQLTENNVLRAEDYDIKATLASDKRGYGEEVRHLHTIVGDSNIQTILRSPTGNKLIMLMRLKREGKLSPAGETALEDARRRLAEKYSILELRQIKEAAVPFYNHLQKLASTRGDREVDKISPRELALVSAVGLPTGYVTSGYARRYIEELSKNRRPALSRVGGVGSGILLGSLAARGALYAKRALGVPDPDRERRMLRARGGYSRTP